LLGLRLKGNPCVRKMQSYRRALLLTFDNLAYLDDRPVLELERIGIKAFKEGGKEAELKAKEDFLRNQNNWQTESCARGKQIFDEAKIERKKQFKRMMEEIQAKRSELPSKRKELKTQLKSLDMDTTRGKEVYRELLAVEQEMKRDWYQDLKKRGEEVPHVMGRSAFQTSK